MSAPFYEIEDLAEQEAGDLSPRRLPVQFLPSKPERVRVRHKARLSIKGWRLEVVNHGTFRTVRAFKGAAKVVCNLGNSQPLRAFLQYATAQERGAL